MVHYPRLENWIPEGSAWGFSEELVGVSQLVLSHGKGRVPRDEHNGLYLFRSLHKQLIPTLSFFGFPEAITGW